MSKNRLRTNSGKHRRRLLTGGDNPPFDAVVINPKAISNFQYKSDKKGGTLTIKLLDGDSHIINSVDSDLFAFYIRKYCKGEPIVVFWIEHSNKSVDNFFREIENIVWKPFDSSETFGSTKTFEDDDNVSHV